MKADNLRRKLENKNDHDCRKPEATMISEFYSPSELWRDAERREADEALRNLV